MPLDEVVCGELTERGEPCQRPPMTGTQGRCQLHAGLALTERQLAAACTNALKHGFFATGACDEQDDLVYGSTRQALEKDRAGLVQDLVAALAMRAARVLRWEAKEGKATPHADAAFATLLKAMARLPPPAEKDHACLDDAEIVRQVEGLLRDREFLLKQLPKPATAKVRAVLEEEDRGGAAAAPA